VTIIGSLHDGQCKSASECSCTPYLVRETPTEGEGTEYTSMSRVELQSDRLRREASPVLNPLVAPRSVIEVEQ
jgi:hypothetical protein